MGQRAGELTLLHPNATLTLEATLRQHVIDAARQMNALGINQGTSGNISVRHNDTMLITPSAMAYDDMQPHHLAAIGLSDDSGSWSGPSKYQRV